MITMQGGVFGAMPLGRRAGGLAGPGRSGCAHEYPLDRRRLPKAPATGAPGGLRWIQST
jgi:hypothetical protein